MIFDRAGDTTTHDLATLNARFDATDMFVDATFHPGTLQANDLAFIVFFDLDQNPATGSQAAGIGSGSDVGLIFNSLLHPAQVRVRGNLAPVTFGADSFSISLPLTVLADDGHANFGMVVGDPTSELTFNGRDVAADADFGGPLSTATQFVPEPASRLLAALALLCLVFGVSRAGDPRKRRHIHV